MTVFADYHMHTPLCRHAVGEPAEYAQAALATGLDEIGFSDHAPMPQDDFDDWRMRAGDLDRYIAKVEQTRRQFPQLTIRLGLEFDFIPGYEDWIRELTARHPWDHLIGSVHYISPSWAIDNPRQISEWKQHDPGEVWTAYFERLTAAAKSGLFDIIGHADLCKKFCFYPVEDCTRVFRRFIEAAHGANVAIELNTAGLRKECHEIYPSLAILKLAAQAGVPITFGSDAHAPAEVGLNFPEAAALAREAGYTRYCRFNARRREERAL